MKALKHMKIETEREEDGRWLNVTAEVWPSR